MVRGGAELSAQFPAQRQLDKGTGRNETQCQFLSETTGPVNNRRVCEYACARVQRRTRNYLTTNSTTAQTFCIREYGCCCLPRAANTDTNSHTISHAAVVVDLGPLHSIQNLPQRMERDWHMWGMGI
jgi:hypothetical protein